MLQHDDRANLIHLKEYLNLPKVYLEMKKIELEHFTRGSSKMVLKMVVASLVTNVSIVFAFQC